MENQQLESYVRQHLAQGYPADQIKHHLLQHGWSHHAVDQAFQHVHAQPAHGHHAVQHDAASLHGQSDKSYVGAWLLSYFFGSFGADRFYLGYIGTGLGKLLTFGGLGIWALIDIFRIAFGTLKDKDGRTLEGFAQNSKIIKILTIILVAALPLAVVGIILLFVFLSVPALQQAARGTSQRNDIAQVATGMSTYASAHDNTLPLYVEPGDSSKTLRICAVPLCAQDEPQTVQLSYFDPTAVKVMGYSQFTSVPDADTLYVVAGATCDSALTGVIKASRSLAFMYIPSGTYQQTCVAA